MSILKRARYSDPFGDRSQPQTWTESSEEDVEEELERMGRHLHDYLIQLKIMGKLTATHITTIAYFHRLSGGRGCDRIALPPQKEPNRDNPDLKNASRIL
jgi:hypothetical protein